MAKVLPILAKSGQVLPNRALRDFGEDSKLLGPVLHMWGLRKTVYMRCQERIVGLVAFECCRPSLSHSSVDAFPFLIIAILQGLYQPITLHCHF